VDLSQSTRRPPAEPRGAVKVRERASRRAAQPPVAAAEAAARAHQVAEPCVDGDTQPVGVSRRPSARLGTGRRRPIRETTRIAVPLETGTEAWSGVVKKAEGTWSRGDTLAPWRT